MLKLRQSVGSAKDVMSNEYTPTVKTVPPRVVVVIRSLSKRETGAAPVGYLATAVVGDTTGCYDQRKEQ